MLANDPDILFEIVNRLVAEFGPGQIFPFGSRAWGEPKPDSDYDLMVVLAESLDGPAQRAFRALRCLRKVGIAKDVIVITRDEFERSTGVTASLEPEVLERGRVLYGRSQVKAGAELAQEGVA
jgi:predicted nucleotidyltransferase